MSRASNNKVVLNQSVKCVFLGLVGRAGNDTRKPGEILYSSISWLFINRELQVTPGTGNSDNQQADDCVQTY